MTIEIQITTTEVGTTEEVTTLVEVAGAGAQGPVGPGVPAGGTEFQLIEKASGTDYDTRWTSEPTVDGILFDTTAGLQAEVEGELVWDDDAGTIDLGMNDGVLQRVGEDTFYRVQADEAISKGDVLMSVGTVGSSSVILVAKARPTYNGSPVISQQLMGLAPANIAQGERGYALAFGRLRKVNTDAYLEGDILWADPTVAGGLTKVKPEAPNWRVIVALVVTKSATVGSLQVRPTFGGSLADDELVYINGITDNQILRYNSATERFEAESLGTAADADTGDFATAAQGLLADTATQPGDNISTLTNDANYIDASGAPVQSVNAQTGAVTLTATDVGAYPDTNPNGYIDASGAPVQSVDGLTGTVDLSGNYDALGSASAVQSNLDTHVGDTTNPHAVTKTQVGLGNVDNVSAADLRDRSTHTGTQPATTVTYSNTASGLTAVDVQGAIDELADRTEFVGAFTWDSATTSPAASIARTVPQSVLTNLYDNIKGCTLLDNGSVNYYLNASDWSTKAGGGASDLTGADGQVMVEIPAFYYRVSRQGTETTWEVSYLPLSGFSLHPAFILDGVQVSHRYYGAYDACVFDDSASAYISGLNLDNNSGNVDTGTDKLASVKGIYPMVGLTRNEFRLLAANRGSGWRQLDFPLWCAVGMLYVVEYQTFYSQDELGAGNTNGSYVASSSDQNDSPHTIAGAGDAWGNASTDGTQPSAGAKPGTAYMKYRGIENQFGNCWNWADAINVNVSATGNVHIADDNDRANYADNTATNHTLVTSSLTTGSANISDFLPVDPYFLAESTGGTSAQYVTDRHFGSLSSNRVVPVGVDATGGGLAGVFALSANASSGVRARAVGGRLAR